ncbi:MAG: hypothetical protein QOE33_764 [Acidobacteriota bacterium]|nr:hypothetical protein [Acidobacteriota bacterium]
MAHTLEISVSDLLIDVENPRLPQPNVGQREAQREFARHQQRKLLVLAEDIVRHGLNLADLPIVMPFDARRFVVLEGNRRFVALQALENPDLMVGAFTSTLLTALRKLSAEYQQNPIEAINCLVVKDREEARHMIELRHTGEREGAGIVRWGADESTRFKARAGDLEVHTQALDFLEDHNVLTPERRREVPTASLKRLLSTPEVREKLGVDVQDKKLVRLASDAQVAKALIYVVDRLVSGKTKTKEIYHKADRVKYANALPADIVATPTVKSGRATSAKKGAQPKPKPAPPPKPLRQREQLIPGDCTLNVTELRHRQIESELRRLNLNDYTNAVSVLFRVFIELTADDYITRMKLTTTVDKSLMKKLVAVATDLESRQKLTKQQAIPVHRAAAKDSFLAPSITQMNQYVHNPLGFPAPIDLRAYWDSLQPFFIAIWTP